MKVSISKAASMVGITRATLYRHIKKKDISVHKDEDGNPKIDVSELIRVYGDQVRVSPKAKVDVQDIAVSAKITPEDKPAAASDKGAKSTKKASKGKSSSLASELRVLYERIKNHEAEKENWKKERQRERELLMEQVENLRQIWGRSQEQQHRLTALLTDQTQKAQKSVYAANSNSENRTMRQIEMIQDTVQRLENQNKRIAFELQREKNKKFFKRVFG